MTCPANVAFFGDMRVVRYSPDDGVVMERAPEGRTKLLFGLFFSVGLVLVGALLFWGKAYDHYLAGRFSFVDWFLIVVGLPCVVFGLVVAMPLATRLMPRRLQTRHGSPALALRGLVRSRVWQPDQVRLFRIHGRGFVRRTDPDTKKAFYTCTLVLVAEPRGWATRLFQTPPLPDGETAYSEIYRVARYLADLMGRPLEYRDNWETKESIPAPRPASE